MNEQKTHSKLIDGLTADLTPVKSVRHPLWYFALWMLFAVVYFAIALPLGGVRPDFTAKLANTEFVFEILLCALLALTAAFSTGWLAIPDMRGAKWLLVPPVTLFAVFLLWMIIRTTLEDVVMPAMNLHHCAWESLLMGGVPAALLVFFSKRGTTTHPLWMALMSFFTAGSLGWIAMKIICKNDNMGHTFFYHFLPLVLLGTVVGLFARRLYRW